MISNLNFSNINNNYRIISLQQLDKGNGMDYRISNSIVTKNNLVWVKVIMLT